MPYRSGSAKETEEIARGLIRMFRPGTIVTLEGPFGAGKTTFVRGVLRGLGFRGRVVSPSFLIRKTYHLRRQRTATSLQQSAGSWKLKAARWPLIRRIHHLDGYRIKHRSELEPLGLEEVFTDPRALTFVEWPKPFGPLLRKRGVRRIVFFIANPRQRRIRVS